MEIKYAIAFSIIILFASRNQNHPAQHRPRDVAEA